jgi:dTDP-glucose 4,6-dehydratase
MAAIDKAGSAPLRIMVTGGAGFIGSALVRHLIDRSDHCVLNLDKLTYSASLASLAAIEEGPRYRFARGDIGDAACVADLLEDFRPDVVVNLAAETHVDRSICDPEAFIRTNLLGTYTLLEEVRRYLARRPSAAASDFRFHHVSTDEVYGALGTTGQFDERSPYDPQSPYSASKAGADHLVRAWGNTFGVPYVVTNSTNNYGPCQFPEKLIPLTITRALEGASLPVYGDGQQVRDWLFVEDHVRALRQVFERGAAGETYAISGHCERTNLAVVRAVCETLDELRPLADGRSYAAQIEFVVDRPGHDRRYSLNAAKIHRELGWQAETSFEVGIARTVAWYLENRAWWENRLRGGPADRIAQPLGIVKP